MGKTGELVLRLCSRRRDSFLRGHPSSFVNERKRSGWGIIPSRRPDGSHTPAMSWREPFGLCGNSWFAGEWSGFVYLKAIWLFCSKDFRVSGSV